MDMSLSELQELVMDREAGVLWFMGFPSVVLAGETNLAVKGTFETEESGKNSMC